MNRKFAVKMIRAKQLQYEALKEIMPEKLANQVGRLEKEVFDIAKECFLSIVSENEKNQTNDVNKAERVRKVTIE